VKVDFSRLNRGEQIAGIAGALLLFSMFAFDWFGVKDAEGGLNAWKSFSFIDLILFVAALSGVGLLAVKAASADESLPVPLSSVTTLLGGLAVLLVLYRVINPPDLEVTTVSTLGSATVQISADVTRKLGIWTGLILTSALTYGGWLAMQEDPRSAAGQGDRFAR